eukprot:scaffold3026_cov221-Pinguiococcus_pyrenoidosus.AAC.15
MPTSAQRAAATRHIFCHCPVRWSQERQLCERAIRYHRNGARGHWESEVAFVHIRPHGVANVRTRVADPFRRAGCVKPQRKRERVHVLPRGKQGFLDWLREWTASFSILGRAIRLHVHVVLANPVCFPQVVRPERMEPQDVRRRTRGCNLPENRFDGHKFRSEGHCRAGLVLAQDRLSSALQGQRHLFVRSQQIRRVHHHLAEDVVLLSAFVVHDAKDEKQRLLKLALGDGHGDQALASRDAELHVGSPTGQRRGSVRVAEHDHALLLVRLAPRQGHRVHNVVARIVSPFTDVATSEASQPNAHRAAHHIAGDIQKDLRRETMDWRRRCGLKDSPKGSRERSRQESRRSRRGTAPCHARPLHHNTPHCRARAQCRTAHTLP